MIDAAVGITDAANSCIKSDKYENAIDQKKLLPTIYGPNTATPNYPELFEKIISQMQANRKKVFMNGPYGETT